MNIPNILKPHRHSTFKVEKENFDWEDINNDFDRLKMTEDNLFTQSKDLQKLFKFLSQLNLKHSTVTSIYDMVRVEVNKNGITSS